MDDSVATYIQFENGPKVPIQYISPFSIKQTRGMDPYMFGVVTSDISQIPQPSGGDAVKCSFLFETPGSGGRVNKEWGGWYLVRMEPSRSMEGLWVMTFADERWRVQYRRFTMSYNVQWPDGSFREGTASGVRGWSTRDAIRDAMDRMGYKVDMSEVPTHTDDKLPFNLGNSPAGGWVQASFQDIIGPMLYALKMDMIVKTDGTFKVVPRVAVKAAQVETPLDRLRKYSRIGDTVGVALNKTERPRKLRVAFEIMAEAAIESEIKDTSGSVPSQPIFEVPDNVMPRWEAKLKDPEDWWESQTETPETDWDRISSQLFDAGYLPTLAGNPLSPAVSLDEFLGKQYFLDQVVPIERDSTTGWVTDNVATVEKKLWFDSTIRNTWRRVYRVIFPTARNPHPSVKDERRIAGLRLGRLTPGGDTHSRGSVFCDWCEETNGEVDYFTNPYNATYSVNHPLSDDITRPSPFSARWIAQSGGELIFLMEPTTNIRVGQVSILPGVLSKPINHIEWQLAAQGLPAIDSHRAELDPEFDFRVIMAGRLIGEDERDKTGLDSPGVDITGRYAVIESDTEFVDGNIDSIDFMASTITANYGYTLAQLQRPIGSLAALFPDKLLNPSELLQTQRRIKANIERDFRMGNAGGVQMASVEAMGEVETGGDVYEFSVAVGNPDPWSITTQWIFAPGAIAWSVDKPKRDGPPPHVIEQG